MSQNIDCGTRQKIVWKHLDRRTSEYTMLPKCKGCEDAQKDYCIRKSWVESGRNPKLLEATKLLENKNPNADKKAKKMIAEAESKLVALSAKETSKEKEEE